MNLPRTDALADAHADAAFANYQRAYETVEAYAEEHDRLSTAEYQRLMATPTAADIQEALEYFGRAEGIVIACAYQGDPDSRARESRVGFALLPMLSKVFEKMAGKRADVAMEKAEAAARGAV